MGNAVGDITSGIVTLTQGSNAGPRRSVRLGAQGAISGYRQTAPTSLALNRVYQPAYLGLGGENLEALLFGSPARTITRSALSPSGVMRDVTEDVPGSAGFLDILGRAGNRIQDLYQQGAERGVESNLGLLSRALPQAQAFRDATNPALAALRGRLGDTANEQLALGGRLDPATLARITQAVRGNWAQRGLGTSAPAQLDEAVRLQLEGENLNQTRTATAGNIFNSLSANEPDFAKFILGLGGNPVGDALRLTSGQQPLAYQGNWFNPFNPVAGSLSQTGAGLGFAKDQANAEAAGKIGGGIFDLVAGAYTGGMSGMMGGGG